MALISVDESHTDFDPAYHRDADGIFRPSVPVDHRDGEFDAAHFDMLLDMQARHFWYQGRHRFLLRAVADCCRKRMPSATRISAIDLGGGCGGWIKYLIDRAPARFAEVALADSSLRALQLAGPVVGNRVQRYQADLNSLQWRERWDVAFLLDVLEHIPGDVHVLQEICRTLRPGGLLFVTTPALNCFWSYNDTLVHHVRRYSRGDFRRLATACEMELVFSRYFMTLLSPLLLLSRLRGPKVESMSKADIIEYQRRTHRVPASPLNRLLSVIFSLESPMGHWLPFPWGTSVLAVLRKPT